MSRTALVVQNVDIEGPGLLAEWLGAAGWRLDVRRAFAGDPLPPDLEGHGGLVVLGGFMSVHDQADFPHLARAEDLIRLAVARGLPTLGVCLGAQLIAKAFGARVAPNRVKEIGVDRVTLTAAGAADPLFAGLGPEVPVFQWHGDTFDLPPGGVLLAESPACRHQAFRLGPNAYGLQFHLEVTEDMVAAWAQAYREELLAHDGRTPEALVAAFRAASPALDAAAAALARNLARVFAA